MKFKFVPVVLLALISLVACGDKGVDGDAKVSKQELKVRKPGESGFSGFSSSNARPDHIKPNSESQK